MFPMRPDIKFYYTFRLKNGTNCEKMICLMPARTENLRSFKVHDMITCESKVHFLLQSENVFELGGITIPLQIQVCDFFSSFGEFICWLVGLSID